MRKIELKLFSALTAGLLLLSCGKGDSPYGKLVGNHPLKRGRHFARAYFQGNSYQMKRFAYNALHDRIEFLEGKAPLVLDLDRLEKLVKLEDHKTSENVSTQVYSAKGSNQKIILKIKKYNKLWMVSNFSKDTGFLEKLKSMGLGVEEVGQKIFREAKDVVTGK